MTKSVQLITLVFVVALCGHLSLVKAQEKIDDKVASFKGRMFRSDTNKPIAQARVVLLDDKRSEKQDNSQETVTDTDGNFSFDRVLAGKYTVSIRVTYANEADVPCQLLLGKLKGEKDSQLLVVSEGEKKIYQVLIKGFAVKANKNISKEYDLVCVSAFGG